MDLRSVGTLLAYSLVDFSVLVLRYHPDEKLSSGKNEKTEREALEMKTVPEAASLERSSDAGISGILRSLCIPMGCHPPL